MAFGVISTLYFPIAGSAGSSQWGSDVRKMLDSADGTADTTTITSHGTSGGQTLRTCDPYTTNSSDLTQADYGWAVTPTDMNSVDGALRFTAAGNWVLTSRIVSSSIVAGDTTVNFYIYRVGPAASRTRTLLGNAATTASIGTTVTTVTVTVALGSIVFAEDETVQFSCEVSAQSVIITGRTVTFHTGTQGGVAIRVDMPELGILAKTSGTITGDAAVDADAALLLNTAGTITGTATVAGVTSSTWGTSGTVTGTATVAGVPSSTWGTTGTITGDATVDADGAMVLGTEFTIDTGGSGTSTGYAKSRVVNG